MQGSQEPMGEIVDPNKLTRLDDYSSIWSRGYETETHKGDRRRFTRIDVIYPQVKSESRLTPTNAPLVSDLLETEKKWQQRHAARQKDSNPLLEDYKTQVETDGQIRPLKPEELPPVLYHAARCVIETPHGPKDQLESLLITGLIGPDSTDTVHEGRFYLASEVGFSLKELPLQDPSEALERVMLLTIDPVKLQKYKDLYPDPESIVMTTGEFGIDHAVLGQIPLNAIKKIEVFDQQILPKSES